MSVIDDDPFTGPPSLVTIKPEELQALRDKSRDLFQAMLEIRYMARRSDSDHVTIGVYIDNALSRYDDE